MMDAADVDKDGRIDYAGQSVSQSVHLRTAARCSAVCDL